MTGETPWAGRSWEELATEAEAGLRGQGALVETTRRLVDATERQSRASAWFTGVIIGLTFVQIFVTAVQAWIALLGAW
jgi:hypothetical protein